MEEKNKIRIAIVGHGSVGKTEIIKRMLEKDPEFIVMNEEDIKSFTPELAIPITECEVKIAISAIPIPTPECDIKCLFSDELFLEPRLPYYANEKRRKYYEPQRHPYIQKRNRKK